MNVFDFRDKIISDYDQYIESFVNISDSGVEEYVRSAFDSGSFWPDPLIQLNPAYEAGESIEKFVTDGVLNEKCLNIFRKNKSETDAGSSLRLYRHQAEAIHAAAAGNNYVLTTGTGSGKSLSYIIPIVDHVLRNGSGRGVQAIIIYPMNALANSQFGELEKFLCFGYPKGKPPVTFQRYTGQESKELRQDIVNNPPDIILTNYVMLELMLTRVFEKNLIKASKGLRFLVLDELHTYRGRQGADVALLIRRLRNRLDAGELQCVGTSATMASGGTFAEQQKEVARVAAKLFGASVEEENVIGETLRRATASQSLDDSDFIKSLKTRITDGPLGDGIAYEEFVADPLSVWIETTFGIEKEESGRLVRVIPKAINGPSGAAKQLSSLTGLSENDCEQAVKNGLLAGYRSEPDPETGFKPFAFRLHQFISRADTVYATLESEDERYMTINKQQFKPGSRRHRLLPLVFCRECGQAYYCVRKETDTGKGQAAFVERELRDRISEDSSEPGFLYLSRDYPWPEEEADCINRVPDEWIEESGSGPRIRAYRRKNMPQKFHVNTEGIVAEDGESCDFIGTPFMFCLKCGVAYGARQSSDFPKLGTLGTEGRSMATTILSLTSVLHLMKEGSLAEKARKLLSFSDNRQDASLQAGHFNDFVEIGILRSAIYRAARDSGANGLRHDEIAQKVFEALNLPIDMYAQDPTVRFANRENTDRALKDLLGYRIYRDLRRGWRISSPNLEQCGLLKIEYQSVKEIASAEDLWEGKCQSLANSSPENREKIIKVLLDYMRRELCIFVDALESNYQERIKHRSSQHLLPPWSIDEQEKMHSAGHLIPRSRKSGDYQGFSYLSARGGFGQYLRRMGTFQDNSCRPANLKDTDKVIKELLQVLSDGAGLLKQTDFDGDTAYQLPASVMIWKSGDGSEGFHDPLRMPNIPDSGIRTNNFFIDFYKLNFSHFFQGN